MLCVRAVPDLASQAGQGDNARALHQDDRVLDLRVGCLCRGGIPVVNATVSIGTGEQSMVAFMPVPHGVYEPSPLNSQPESLFLLLHLHDDYSCLIPLMASVREPANVIKNVAFFYLDHLSGM